MIALVIIAALVGLVAFWVVAAPHEQCHVGHGVWGPEGSRIVDAKYPIEKTAPDSYSGVPSQFGFAGYLSSEIVHPTPSL